MTIMANVGSSSAYVVDTTNYELDRKLIYPVDRHYYSLEGLRNQFLSFGYSWLLVMSTQLVSRPGTYFSLLFANYSIRLDSPLVVSLDISRYNRHT
jgi:hypothetical protein